MFLDKSIHKFKVLISNSSAEVLNKYKIEKARILVVVDDENHLKGVITNGDILSWFLENGNVESSNLEGLYNKNCTSIKEDASPGEFSHLLKSYHYIPVIDGEGKFVAMAQRGSRNTFQIGSFKISEKSKTFVIAEIGINHNDPWKLPVNLLMMQSKRVVMQLKYRLEILPYTQSILNDSLKAEHGTNILSELKKSELPSDAFITLKITRQVGILFLATPFDINSVGLLKNMDVPAIKIEVLISQTCR